MRFRSRAGYVQRTAKPEQIVQERVLSWLKFRGFLAWHVPNRGLYDSKTNRYNLVDRWHVPGVPDIEVALPGGVTVRIELKSITGRVSPEQSALIARLDALGHPTFVARCVEDVETFFRSRGYIK